MPVLNKIKEVFGFTYHEEPPAYVAPPSLEDRLGEAAAERGYAFDMLSEAREALRAAADTEAYVAAEAIARAEKAVAFSRQQAERILATGQANAEHLEDMAATAQTNAVDDSNASFLLASLMVREDDVVLLGSGDSEA